ncbi:MAG: flagellar M-ring protein FliF [Armatimonadetes bacterium]|nr:flagellar M-ring protein FliF [Armatimonadota bacterium]
MGGFILKLKTWWQTADRTQKTVSTVGSGFLLLLIIGTYVFASKPHLSPLVLGLATSEQGLVAAELQKMGVPYDLTPSGDILVPDDKVAELRAKLAASGKLPAGARFSTDDQLAKLSMTTTPRVEKERLKAILESQLSQDIQSLDGVATAQVHIALGDDSPFVTDRRPATASVTLGERGGTGISRDQARGIATLVANSVPGLDLPNVVVLNGRGEPLVDPGENGSAQGKVAQKLEVERSEAKRRERDLQGKLDAAFGPGATIATVDLEIDFDAKEFTETTHKPTDPIVETESKEKMQGGAGPGTVGGPTGAAANTPGAPGAANAAGGSGDSKYENVQKQYVPMTNDRVERGELSAGTVKRMAINVMVDSTKVTDTTVVDKMLKGYLGPRAADTANFTAAVTATAFDTAAQKAAKDAAASAGGRDKMQQIFSLLPVGALLLVAVMVMKSLGKVGKMADPFTLAMPGGQVFALPGSGLDVSPEIAERLGLHNQLTQGGGNASSLPGGSGEHIPMQMRANGPAMEDEDVELESIKRKINVPLEQIKRISKERPELVAILLKSWLMEERK